MNSTKKQSSLLNFIKKTGLSNQTTTLVPQSSTTSTTQTPQKLKRSYSDVVNKLIEEAKAALSSKSSGKHSEISPLVKGYANYNEDQKIAILALTPYLTLSEIQVLSGIPINTIKHWQTSGTKDKRKENSGRRAPLKDLEKDLYAYFCELRRLGSPVNNHILIKKMRELYAKDQGISVAELDLAQRFQKSVTTV